MANPAAIGGAGRPQASSRWLLALLLLGQGLNGPQHVGWVPGPAGWRGRPPHGASNLAPGKICKPAAARVPSARARGLVVVHHGPSGPLEELANYLVPQPGPQWINEKAIPAPVVPDEEGVEEGELRWRKFLTALVPERDNLLQMAVGAEDDMRRSAPVSILPAPEDDGPEARAARRAVWANLGKAVTAAFVSLVEEDDRAAQVRAAQGEFVQAAAVEHCLDVEGLAAAIDNAWTKAACDVELLWAAQALLRECRRLYPVSVSVPVVRAPPVGA